MLNETSTRHSSSNSSSSWETIESFPGMGDCWAALLVFSVDELSRRRVGGGDERDE